jgi:invasion protein IalB
MAFGGEAVRDLLLGGTTAVIEIFSAGQRLKSCSLSLAGLEEAYRTMSQRLKQ